LPGRCCSERFECVSAFAMRTPEPNGRFSEKSAAGGIPLSRESSEADEDTSRGGLQTMPSVRTSTSVTTTQSGSSVLVRSRCERRSRTDASRKSPPPVGPHFRESACGERSSVAERSISASRTVVHDNRRSCILDPFASQGARPPECDCSTSTIKTRAVRLATARIEGCEYLRARRAQQPHNVKERLQ
jgi:hypothetical protein